MILMNLARRSFPPGRLLSVRIIGCSFIWERIGSFPVSIYVVKWVRGEARKVSELEKTIDLLEEMDDEQLQAIQTVAKILVFRKPKDNVKNTISDSEKEAALKKGKKRTAGLYRGQIYIADDFDAPLSDFKEYM